MLRKFLAASFFLLAACPSPRPPPAPDAPAAPAGPHELHLATLTCTMDLPPGWKMNGGVMPDHVIEAFSDDMTAQLMVEQAREPTVSAAVDVAKRRTAASWSGQPGFALVREDALGSGRLLVYSWAPDHHGSPPNRHLRAVFLVGGEVLAAVATLPPAIALEPLTASLSTVRCQPKGAP
ncbi:MAG: hypothetical protein HYS27_00385 [Deltaproteobacteria bacterium]|nr:hypothetical protein [Deltaproteobacteria bacterium]